MDSPSGAGWTDERPWLVATRVTLLVVELILGVLVVSGFMLVFRYRPDANAAFAVVHRSPSRSQMQTVHRIASQGLLLAFGCLAIAATGLALVRHRVGRIIPLVVGGLGVVAASVSGFLLPWDQLALNHVTVGTNIRGYGRILFGHDVKFVILGNTEVAPSTVARWFWFHVVVTSLIVVVSLVIVARHARAEIATLRFPGPRKQCQRHDACELRLRHTRAGISA
jgi:quinol-cytochrome oxidoreductase complex cytochrome b subunit